MLSFGDCVEHADAAFRKLGLERPEFELTRLTESHIFNLGEDESFMSSAAQVGAEMYEDCDARMPMPFSDVTCVSLIQGWGPALGGVGPGADTRNWMVDRVRKITPDHRPLRRLLESLGKEATDKAKEIKEWFVITRCYTLGSQLPPPKVWFFGFAKISPEGQMTGQVIADPKEYLRLPPGEARSNLLSDCGRESITALTQVIAISHPANYVIRVTPELTAREKRKFEQGRERPIRKKPHFIVVDHEVLVGMRKSSLGGGRSPSPHHRRGHWMCLAERCRLAREAGKSRVWVRETFVGDPTWSDGKNVYDVLPVPGTEQDGSS